jgi:hypothetical protein
VNRICPLGKASEKTPDDFANLKDQRLHPVTPECALAAGRASESERGARRSARSGSDRGAVRTEARSI